MNTRTDYRTRFLGSLAEIPAADWDRLIPALPGACFVRHAFLHAMESADCLGRESGWEPAHWTLWDPSGACLAAMPLYRKWHSYGEYVFDWAWAEAYLRHGLAYYPKWLSAVPFTPVSGPRLLCPRPTPAILQRCLSDLKAREGSSVHLLFPKSAPHATPAGAADPVHRKPVGAVRHDIFDEEAQSLQDAGFRRRDGIQFHWFNRGFDSFEGFLQALSQPKRKKIRAERRKVAELDIHFTVHTGSQITPERWAFFYTCYARTYEVRGNPPYLNPAFFWRMHQAAPELSVLFIGHDALGPCCASLVLRDGDHAFGRYWGAVRDYPFVHFEACYYQPILWAIAEGIQVIEGGAQGQHKMARGFDPVTTSSWHWLRHPAFAEAVDRFLTREAQHLGMVLDELEERSAFRDAARSAV